MEKFASPEEHDAYLEAQLRLGAECDIEQVGKESWELRLGGVLVAEVVLDDTMPAYTVKGRGPLWPVTRDRGARSFNSLETARWNVLRLLRTEFALGKW